jgi:hypothetical protein
LIYVQATPHLSSKRRSLHGRKLRPKSVVDATDLSADDIPDLLPPLRSVEGMHTDSNNGCYIITLTNPVSPSGYNTLPEMKILSQKLSSQKFA